MGGDKMTYYATYFFNTNRTIVVDMMGQNIDLCEEVNVTKVVKNITSNETCLSVRITLPDGSYSYVELPRKTVCRNPLPDLTAAGLSITNVSIYATTLSEILLDLSKSAPISYQHSRLGFFNVDDKKVFLSAETAIPNGISRHSDYENLRPRGDFHSWRSGMIPFITNKPETAVALAMGASAPVANLLETAGVLDESGLYALIGCSGRSKTTILKATASIFGPPNRRGLIRNLLCTENYLIETLHNLDGFPYFIDESSVASFDFTSLIYGLANNLEKGRCNSDGTAKPVRYRNCSVIMFTGEQSMLAQSNGNTGLFSRLLEFDFLWTQNASAAESLTKLVSEQYGTAGPIFVNFLQSFDIDILVKMYGDNICSIKSYITPQNSVEERIVKKLALLRLTCQIMQSAWDFSIDMSAIDAVLLEAFEQNSPKADKYEVLYETLTQYIFAHAQLFPDEETLKIPQLCKIPKQGMHSTYNGQRCVWLLSTFFDEFLQKNGMASITSNHREMQNRGMLVYHTDRFKKIKTLGKSGSVLCYCLLLNRTTTATNSTPKKKNKKISQIDQLLADEKSEE